MKKLLKLILVLLLLLSYNCFSQTIADPYEVGTWQGFRSAAVSYTFDDNCPNQLLIAVPMFNEFGFKLTLFAVTSPSWAWPANWSGIQAAASQGHEIACHTVTHPHFSGLAYATQVNEIKNSKDTIESHNTGDKCVTIAYPYCETGYDTLVAKYYLAARICSGSIEPKTPSNFMRISSIICGNLGVNTSAAFKSRVDNAAISKGWCVYLFHGINNDEPNSPYSPIAADTLRKSLEYLKANPDKFWVASFGNVAKYIRERDATSVSEISVRQDSIIIAVTDTIDNSYYDSPITVRRPLPQGWASAEIMQNGTTISSGVVEINSVRYVMFDVVPDNGNIILVKSGASGIEQQGKSSNPKSFELYQNYPNPFNPATQISYSIPQNSYITLKLYNLLGQEVITLFEGVRQPGNYEATFDGSGLGSGVYFYMLKVGGFMQTRKLLLLR